MEHSAPTSWLLHLPLLPSDPHYIHVNGAVVVFLFILLVSLAAHWILRKSPEAYLIPAGRPTLVSIVDVTIEGLHNMVTGALGEGGEKYFPFIASVFLFVFFCNCLGLLPMSFPPTGNTSTTFGIGLAAFFYYNIQGVREQGFKGYLEHFLMGLGPAGVVIALLEMVSHLIRPFSLGIRLFVNMHVDHAVVHSVSTLTSWSTWLVPVPLLLFGIVVCTIQAFVFAMLTAVYVEMATAHEH
jgi:F-type H+-transporting ATPase subunit a